MPNSLAENVICRFAANTFALALIYLAQPHVHGDPISIDWVTVGDPGNANDMTGYGAVNYEYRIAKHEVTIQQYTDFLNAVAASDSSGLYFLNMGSDPSMAGIARTGSSGAFAYAVIGPSGLTPAGAASPGNRPVSYVNWFNAARFANWMSNGQPTGPQGPTTTENGAYDLSLWFLGIALAANGTNPNTGSAPLYRIPTENEWYKAAYYKGGGPTAGYWAYATQSDSAPGNVIGGAANQANYAPGGVFAVPQSASFAGDQNLLTEVGAFSGSPSAYGTFDQTGNVFEWNDLDGTGGFSRGLRGGNFASDTATISAALGRGDLDPLESIAGFRLVSPVPEPSTVVMVVGGLAWAALGAWRRRARDGARVRAGASLRPCFGLREARLDAEPSPVQPTLGVGCDGPSPPGPWMARRAYRNKRTRGWGNHGSGSGYRGVGLWGGEQPLKRIVVVRWLAGLIRPTPKTYPMPARVSNRFCAEFFSALKPAVFSSLPRWAAPAALQDTWQTLPLLRPVPASLLCVETGCGRLPHPASLPTASKAF